MESGKKGLQEKEEMKGQDRCKKKIQRFREGGRKGGGGGGVWI